MSITEAIEVLQSAIRRKYGNQVDTEGGAASLTIAHDRVELTDADSSVEGWDTGECVEILES
jgi:hypothetical protein